MRTAYRVELKDREHSSTVGMGCHSAAFAADVRAASTAAMTATPSSADASPCPPPAKRFELTRQRGDERRLRARRDAGECAGERPACAMPRDPSTV